jgi:hypothetical protein
MACRFAIPWRELPSGPDPGRVVAVLEMRRGGSVFNPQDLVDRYVRVWNEPDAERRREAIATLWTEDGVQILQPPQQILQAAAVIGFIPTLEARGYQALEARVTRAYEEFIAPGEFAFRPRDNVARLDDVVKFNWEMVPTSGGEAAGAGLEILILDPDGRIRIDYQFVEG